MGEQSFPSLGEQDPGLERKSKILFHNIERDVLNFIKERKKEKEGINVIFQKLLARIKEKISRLKLLRDDELSNILASLPPLQEGREEVFGRIVAKIFTPIFLDRFSFSEIEKIDRGDVNELHVNRLIRYEIAGTEMKLHVFATFVDNPHEILALFKDALHKIQRAGVTLTTMSQDGSAGSAEITAKKLIEIHAP